MKLADFISLSHTEDFVIYLGYSGDSQVPALETNSVKLAIEKYGELHVMCFEAVEDRVYIWLESIEDRLWTLARKLIDKLYEDEDDANMVAEILRGFGFDKRELSGLEVCDKDILDAF